MVVKRIPYKKLYEEKTFLPLKLAYKPPKASLNVKKLINIASINPISRRFLIEDFKGSYAVFLDIGGIDRETGRITGLKKIQKNNLTPRARLIAYKGDILIPLIQVSKFIPSIVEEDSIIVSDNFAVLVPETDPHYLIYALKEEFVLEQLKPLYRGTTILRLPSKELGEILMPWPAENERNKKIEQIKKEIKFGNTQITPSNLSTKINDAFESYFKITISSNTKSINRVPYEKLNDGIWDTTLLLKEKSENIFKDINSNIIKSLQDICESIKMGVNPSKFKTEDSKSKELIKAKNINVLSINDPFKEENFDYEKALKNDDFIVKEGDILIRIKGDIGPAAVVAEKYSGMLYHDHMARLRVKKDIDLEYLVAYLNSCLAEEEMKKHARGGTMRYITIKDLARILVIVPEIEKQLRIISKIKS